MASPTPTSLPGSGYIDPNFPNPMGPGDARIIIYGYVPSIVLCIIGIVFFAVAFVLHSYQVFRYRLWSFIPLTFACLLEVLGYVFRSLASRKDPYRITYFVVPYFLIVTAPVLISASIYVCLTKILAWTERQGLVLRGWWLQKKFILWTFVTIDVVCTIAQVAGAALIGVKESKRGDPTAGNNILLAGLAVQSFAFLIFLSLYSTVVVTIFNDKEIAAKVKGAKHPFLGVLAAASLLVFLRTLFRLAETSQGVFGYLSVHEAFFGALETAPIIIAVFLLAVWHPGRWPSQNLAVERKVESVGV